MKVINRVKEIDSTSRRVLRALDTNPRATVGWVAQKLHLARGTVQSRISQLFEPGVLRGHSVTVPPEALGYGIRAICTAEVEQELFDDAVAALHDLPEVLECVATTGGTDLFMQLVARDADDLYVLNQTVLGCPGIRRTSTTIVLRELIPYRIHQLLAD
ncbi:Lrp/AsnC family transcriptional regulator [Kocuria sp. ZOR0020]|uniref:Lrp/AsnC family transcriptional regulator n=1 Tax=Kocuria sp. ZOR0020 TaxID=1339234 RepID=UPI00064744C5|nr:Lrp/AsnC family transcriptional regulator [Kocuria sp. ZOR0020]